MLIVYTNRLENQTLITNISLQTNFLPQIYKINAKSREKNLHLDYELSI